MGELTETERLTIAAVVDGMQARSRRRRKAARQGWAFLATAVLALPVIASALDGMITLPTAILRISLALALTTVVVAMAGSLFDSYQVQAATKTVENAVEDARRAAEEAAAKENESSRSPVGSAGGPDHGGGQ